MLCLFKNLLRTVLNYWIFNTDSYRILFYSYIHYFYIWSPLLKWFWFCSSVPLPYRFYSCMSFIFCFLLYTYSSVCCRDWEWLFKYCLAGRVTLYFDYKWKLIYYLLHHVDIHVTPQNIQTGNWLMVLSINDNQS